MPSSRCIAITAAVFSLELIACSRPDTPAREVKGGDGVLRLSLSGEPRTLNPNLGPLLDEYALLVTQNIFSRLVTRTEDGNVLPEVAERWTESADGLSYTFHLRSDVTFHDGRPLTAEDVKSTFARISESSNSELAERLAGVDTPEPHTVTIRLKSPWAAFIASIAWYGASILPAHVYGGGWKDNPANAKPIGSGPFTFRSWAAGDRIVLEKYTGFFGQGPYVDVLEYILTRTPADGAQLLLDGRVDYVMGRPPAGMIRQLSQTPGIRVTLAPSDGRTYLAFNVRHAPFDDVRLRRAVNMALDRRAIVDRALSGIATPALGFYTPAVAWAYNSNARVPAYDPAEARRIVKEVAPPPVLFAFPATPDGLSPLGAEVIRQLRAVGFEVQPHPIRPQELLSHLRSGRDFDMVVLSGAHGPDPDNMAARFGSSGSMQVMGYRNPDLDRTLARGAGARDPLERAASYFRAQEILAADLPIAPLFESIRATAYRDGLRGLPHDDARGLVADYTFNLVRREKR